MRLRVFWIAAAISIVSSAPATADVLLPNHLVCPRGSHLERDHVSAWCEPVPGCSTTADCRSSAARCEPTGLCVERSVRSLPLAFERDVTHAGGVCESDMQCPPRFECVLARRCIAQPQEHARPPVPAVDDGCLRALVVVGALFSGSVAIVLLVARRRARSG